MVSVDSLDLLLIRCLQDNPRASYAEIARLTETSETTVKRRVEALIQGDIITTAVFPNPRRLGYQVQASVGINADLTEVENIALTLREFPEVAYVSLAIGRYDLLVYVVVPTVSHLTRFMLDRMASVPGIRDTETVMTPRVYKAFANWRVPIDGFLQSNGAGDEPVDDDRHMPTTF